MNLVDSVLNTPRTNDKMDIGAAANGGDTMDSEEMQVRTMEVPRWLSTPDVTSKLLFNDIVYNLFSFICKIIGCMHNITILHAIVYLVSISYLFVHKICSEKILCQYTPKPVTPHHSIY